MSTLFIRFSRRYGLTPFRLLTSNKTPVLQWAQLSDTKKPKPAKPQPTCDANNIHKKQKGTSGDVVKKEPRQKRAVVDSDENCHRDANGRPTPVLE